MSLRVVTIGAATVDRYYHVKQLPAADGGSFARRVTERMGGVAANVAAGLARLDHEAAVRTRLGDDEIGDRVADRLAAGPVDADLVRRGPESSTHCVVLREESGERAIVTAGDSVRELRLDETDESRLRAADAVFLTAYAPDPVHERLLSWTDETFPPVVFDLSGPREELAGRGASPESVGRWIDSAWLFVVGRVAARSAFGATGRAAASHLRDAGVGRAAVTAGADGATLVTAAGDLIDCPAVAADVTDETGAGDAYVAGLVHAWLAQDRPPREAGLFAAGAGALNCEATGARGGLAPAAEIREAVAKRDRLD